MRAIGFHTPQPITSETALVDLELPVPEATGHDLLVEIKAIACPAQTAGAHTGSGEGPADA